jgi:hypothetical protein
VFREGAKIAAIGCEDRSTRLRERDDQRIHGRPPAGPPPQPRRSPCKPLFDLLDDVARLQESVDQRISTGVALGALDQHDGGNDRWPQRRVAQRGNECGRAARLLGESPHATRIQHEHVGLSGVATRLPPDPCDEPLRLLPVASRRLPDAIDEPPHIAVGLGQ